MENKAIVIENGFEMDIPEELISYMKDRNISYTWIDARELFFPENRENTKKYFSELPEGQTFYISTVFEDFQQLELFIVLLYKLRHKKFCFKIMNWSLGEEFLNFYEKRESSITPNELEKEFEKDLSEEESKNLMAKIYRFKDDMNGMFLEILKAHDIYKITNIRRDETIFKNILDIKASIRV